MIVHDTRIEKLPLTNHLPGGLPAGAELELIAFVAQRPADQDLVLEFPHPLERWAVLVKTDAATAPRDSTSPLPPPQDLWLLTIPVDSQEDLELLANVRAWVEASLANHQPPSHMMTLQGAQILWSPQRIAVLAPVNRLEAIRKALVQAAFYESELADIERALGAAWPQWEADLPLAFEFDERSLAKRKQLKQRFRDVLLLRARHARIAPQVHAPHLHPATLASQVEERFRERTRLVHRHEFVGEQLEVFEKVYENCSQRASDFVLTRSSNTLEWVIIVLLLAQILFSMFEIVTSLGT